MDVNKHIIIKIVELLPSSFQNDFNFPLSIKMIFSVCKKTLVFFRLW